MNLIEWIKYIAPASPRSHDDVLGIFSSWSLRPSTLQLGSLNVRSRPSTHTSPAVLTCFPLSPSSIPSPWGSLPSLIIPGPSLPKPSCTSNSLHCPQGPGQVSALLLHQTPLELISPSSQAPRLTSCPLLMVTVPLYWFYCYLCPWNPLPRISSSRTVWFILLFPPTLPLFRWRVPCANQYWLHECELFIGYSARLSN